MRDCKGPNVISTYKKERKGRGRKKERNHVYNKHAKFIIIDQCTYTTKSKVILPEGHYPANIIASKIKPRA